MGMVIRPIKNPSLNVLLLASGTISQLPKNTPIAKAKPNPFKIYPPVMLVLILTMWNQY